MTWLAWRQLRTQTLVAAALLAALAILLVLTGPNLRHYADTVVNTCTARHDCIAVTANFHKLAHLANPISLLVIVVPILLGVFWGAPLVARELEAGTYRLAWTQSVTRVRWILVRLVAVTLVAVAITGLLSLVVTWWQSPVDRLNAGLFNSFEARDVVPVAYVAFCVALGALIGALVRRTIAAMAATLGCFVLVRYVVQQYVYPNLLAPLQLTRHFRAPPVNGNNSLIKPPNPADWVQSDQVIAPSGKVLGQYGGIGPHGTFGFNVSNNGSAVFRGVGRCPNRIATPPGHIRPQHLTPAQAHFLQAEIQRCVDSFHLREVLTYQPTSHYWPLQWSEAGIFGALAVALSAACIWWVRRRLP
ncbi:MAG TPA: ABC transporter permease subunit [Acidimicrobiales bacterium]|nr:ABC transporter permease subunit [Acidimicrobiales bacterium]